MGVTEQVQREQFEKISHHYDEVHHQVLSAIYSVSRRRYYPRLAGGSVLDIGNGGQHPSKMLGQELADRVGSFVGLDNSLAMLQRPGRPFWRVQGDGCRLPIRDRAFDYVILNGVLHHLGFTRGTDNLKRIEALLQEARRVSRREIIVYEPFLPRPLECLERGAAFLLGHMPTFMWSEASLDRVLSRLGTARRETVSETLSTLTHPLFRYLLVMEYPRLKLPAFLSPLHHVFFIIPSSP